MIFSVLFGKKTTSKIEKEIEERYQNNIVVHILKSKKSSLGC